MTASTPFAPQAGLVHSAWLHAHLDDARLRIFDCTTNIVTDSSGAEVVVAESAAFAAGHIPGAQFIDLQRDLSDASSPYSFMAPTAAQFEAQLQRWGVDADSIVVIYSTGNPWWATRIWWLFQHFGLDNAYVLDGGFKHWQAQGLPVATGQTAQAPYAPGNITVQAPRQLAIDGDTLLARLQDPAAHAQQLLVNALPPDKFSGAAEVHGGRGHIPGSVNVPAASLIDPATGRFVDDERLRAALQAHGLLDDPRELVCYCGGGISASQLVHALHRAGRTQGVKLYDASMYEWAHRPGFPLVTSHTDRV